MKQFEKIKVIKKVIDKEYVLNLNILLGMVRSWQSGGAVEFEHGAHKYEIKHLCCNDQED